MLPWAESLAMAAAHGSQKLFGLFGGYGLEATGKFMDSLGLHPGILMAGLAGSAEFFGGLVLIIGLATRPAAFVLAFTMVVAILSAHVENGLFLVNKGYEFGLALLAGAASLAFTGAGAYSADAAISGSLDDGSEKSAQDGPLLGALPAQGASHSAKA